MRLRFQLLRSVAVQSAGAASMFAAVLLLGVMLGPQDQGRFNRTKSEIEFITALATLGMPQALFFFTRSGALALPVAKRLAMLLGALGLIVGMGYAALAATPLWTVTAGLGVATAAAVWHAHLRVLLLIDADARWFSLVTSAPQWLLLIAVVLIIAIGPATDLAYSIAFAVSFGVAGALALWRTHRLVPPPPQPPVAWHRLFRYGGATWVSGVLVTASALGMQRGLEAHLGTQALGLFTMALTLAQAPLIPINYGVPLLFKHWATVPAAVQSRRTALTVGALLLVSAALAAVIGAWQPDCFLGPRYADMGRLLPVLLLATSAEAVLRILGAQANATDRPRQATAAESLRFIVLLVIWFVHPPADVLAGCRDWAAAAVLAAASLYGWQWRTAAK